jgi:hypothetical protein
MIICAADLHGLLQFGCANAHLRSRFVTDVTLHPLRISKVKNRQNNLHGLLFQKSVTHGDVTYLQIPNMDTWRLHVHKKAIREDSFLGTFR